MAYDPYSRLREILPEAARQSLRVPRQQTIPLSDEERQSLVGMVTEPVLSGLEVLGNVSDVPGAAVRGILAGDPMAALSPVISPFRDSGRVSGRDLLRRYGMAGPRDTWGNWGAGLAAEVALDPLTYLTLGGSAATKAGRFTKSLGMMPDIGKLATKKLATKEALLKLPSTMTPSQIAAAISAVDTSTARRIGSAEARHILTGGDILRDVPDDLAGGVQDALRAAGTSASEIMDMPLGGQVGFGLPFSHPSHVLTGGRSQAAARILDEIGPALRGAPVVGGLYRGVAEPLVSIFDAPAQQASTPATRRATRQMFREAEKGAAGARQKAAEWYHRLRGSGKDPENINGLYELFESVSEDEVPEAFRGIYRDYRDRLDRIVPELNEMAVDSKPLLDVFNKYVPRATTFAKTPTHARPKVHEVLDATDPASRQRLDITRHIKGGTSTIRSIFMDEDINRTIDNFGGDPDMVAAVLLDKYGDRLPAYVGKNGEYYPDDYEDTLLSLGKDEDARQFDLDVRTGKIRTREQIAASLADWAAELDPEARAKGFYDVNPIVSSTARIMAAEQAIASSKAVHDMMMETGILKPMSDAEEMASLYDIGKDLGLNPGRFVSNIARRRGEWDVIEDIAKDLAEQAKKEDPSIFLGSAIRQYGQRIGIAEEEAKSLRQWNLGFQAPKDASKLVRSMDRLLNAFRTSVTTPWPAFVNRNLLSGQWQNYIAGMWDSQSVADTFNMIRGTAPIKGAARIPLLNRMFKERQLQDLGMSPDEVVIPDKPVRPASRKMTPDQLGPRPEEIEVPPVPDAPKPRIVDARDPDEPSDEVRDVIDSIMSAASEKPGDGTNLVGMRDVRDFTRLDKDEFDEAMLQAARDGIITLTEHDYPASLTEAEKAMMVRRVDPKTGKESFFSGAAIKNIPTTRRDLARDIVDIAGGIVAGADVDENTNVRLIDILRRLPAGQKNNFVDTVKELADNGLIELSEDGKSLKLETSIELVNRPRKTEIDPPDDVLADYDAQVAQREAALAARESAQKLHDNPPEVPPSPDELAAYAEQVRQYRDAMKRYREAVKKHSSELREPTDEEATEIFRELAYAHRISGKYGQHAGQIQQAGTDTGSLSQLRGEIPGEIPFSFERMGRKAVGREPGTTLTGRGDTPLQIRGVTGPDEAIHGDTTFGPLAAAEDASFLVESMNRIAPFLNQIRKGVSSHEAAKRVGGAQVMYHNKYYTPTESEVLTRLFPFYKFSSRVLPWHLARLVEQPGGTLRRSIQLANEGRDENDLRPEYVAAGASIPVGGLLGETPDGTQRYLSGFGLAVEDPAALIGDLTPKSMFGELLSRANPLVRAPAEIASQELFFQRGPTGGREMEDVDPTIPRAVANIQTLIENPRAAIFGGESGPYRPPEIPGVRSLEYLLLNSPAARAITTFRGVVDPRKNLAVKALQYGTGLRVTDVSEAARDSVLREAVEDYIRSNLGGRTFETTYMPSDIRAGMSPEAAARADALERLLREARARGEQRRLQRVAEARSRGS